ncbi:cupin domain-containing protein [Streptomyces sp. NPDC002073]|uniref:cupin domain-containing protein n=1 Tax=Streptomyces sp. NBC_00239 TaxID=2903640 RepID=UPI002E2DB47D|nr:hypothetical protein [Streptomyces sp. NBC_00239]
MTGISREQAPVAMQTEGAELRTAEIGGGFSVAFVRFADGTDMTPAFQGLTDDLCPCPHWGYVTKGTVRMHTKDGDTDYATGEAFYWAPGHAPEAVGETEFLDFSPTEEFNKVVSHVTAAVSG